MDAEDLPEPMRRYASWAAPALSAVLGAGGLYRLFRGLFSGESGSLLAGFALAGLGGLLLRWSIRQRFEWRLAVAAASALCAFYYAWRAGTQSTGNGAAASQAVNEAVYSTLAGGSTALLLFIIAGIALGLHVLGSWGEE